MPSAISSWRLYSWMRLAWTSKTEAGSMSTSAMRLTMRGEPFLVFEFGVRSLAWKPRHQRIVRPPFSRSRSVTQSPPIAQSSRFASPGLAMQQPPPLRHAVGLVAEALRPQLMKLRDQPCLHQFRMKLGDAIYRMAADHRQVRHADLGLAPPFDN